MSDPRSIVALVKQTAAEIEGRRDTDRDCIACSERRPRGECRRSNRACGHHCNHCGTGSGTCCDWCGGRRDC